MAAESELERWCRAYAEVRDCWLVKWVAPGVKGVPDRILLMPNRVVFLEFKAPRGRISSQQKLWGDRLAKLGLFWLVIRSKGDFISVMNSKLV